MHQFVRGYICLLHNFLFPGGLPLSDVWKAFMFGMRLKEQIKLKAGCIHVLIFNSKTHIEYAQVPPINLPRIIHKRIFSVHIILPLPSPSTFILHGVIQCQQHLEGEILMELGLCAYQGLEEKAPCVFLHFSGLCFWHPMQTWAVVLLDCICLR